MTYRNFSNNPNLRKVAPDAFVGMVNVNELDLSGSRLTELPVKGLSKLQRLRLVSVPSLKKLPPVLAFNHLHTAEFTYPYHCCFFKVCVFIDSFFSRKCINFAFMCLFSSA